MDVASTKSSYRSALGECEPVLIRRYTGSGANRPKFDASAMAKVSGYQPQELIGGIVQGDIKVIVLVDDLLSAQFPLPLKKGDKAIVRSKEMNIEAVDDNTRRVGITLIAYELQVRG